MTERRRAATTGEERVRAALQSIGVSARVSNLARADTLDDALGRLEAGALTEADREAAIRAAHQLSGSAGTFGLRPASKLASWFERFFGSPVGVGRDDVALARVRLAELRARLDDPPDLS